MTRARQWHRERWGGWVAVLVVFSLLSCGDGKHQDGEPDGGPDGGADGGVEPVVTEIQPVYAWKIAAVNPDTDPVYPEIEASTFVYPPDDTYLGLHWEDFYTGQDNTVGSSRMLMFYAVAELTVLEGRRLFARGDSVITFFTNNAVRQTGDLYHFRRMLVPLGTNEGNNLLAAWCYPRGNAPEVTIWSTNAEVVFNLDDVTAPEFVVGSDEEQYLGIPVLHLEKTASPDVSAQVLDSQHFEPTAIVYPSLAPESVTQLSFLLTPKAPFAQPGEVIPATVRVESPVLVRGYEASVELTTVDATGRYRRTRRSRTDGSTQYYAVMPPANLQSGNQYGLILSLHGAGVEASGQARSYSPKDWAYLIAATNRHRYGFDWEEWGRLDAIEALEHAMATLPIDPERVHLTGHSMGGHGSWHVGVHFPGRFGVVAPSAGWISFELYTGGAHPGGPIGRARAASETLNYVENFSSSSVFIIHGSADNNVPVTHAQQMFQVLTPITAELQYHEEPGAGHWWDLDPNEEGADCVDWEPMIEVMRNRLRTVTPLWFHFKTPAPWVNPQHSFVTIRSATSPMADCTVDATVAAGHVDIVTDNVRSLVLDGAALAAEGVATVDVDGTLYNVASSPIEHGPQDGKRPDQYGPLNQLWHHPTCYVYDETGPDAYRYYAAHLLSEWAVYGNGQGCAVALSDVTTALEENYNLIYLGVPPAALANGTDLPIQWGPQGITVEGQLHPSSAVAFLYPAGDRLFGYFAAADGSEYLLFRYVPFSSRAGMPDYLVWDTDGVVVTGFFDGDWQIDPLYSSGL